MGLRVGEALPFLSNSMLAPFGVTPNIRATRVRASMPVPASPRRSVERGDGTEAGGYRAFGGNVQIDFTHPRDDHFKPDNVAAFAFGLIERDAGLNSATVKRPWTFGDFGAFVGRSFRAGRVLDYADLEWQTGDGPGYDGLRLHGTARIVGLVCDRPSALGASLRSLFNL